MIDQIVKEIQWGAMGGVCWILGTIWGMVWKAIAAGGPIAAVVYGASLMPPAMWFIPSGWYGHMVGGLWGGELLVLTIAAIGAVSIIHEIRGRKVGDEPKAKQRTTVLPSEVGVGVGLLGFSVSCWGPRGSTSYVGSVVLWSLRRWGIHFAGFGCSVASAGLVSAVCRIILPGPMSMCLGTVVAGVLWLFNMEILGLDQGRRGAPLTAAEAGFFKRLVPCSLLLHTVRPEPLKTYLLALMSYLQWRGDRQEEAIGGSSDLDDSLCKWIQWVFERWRAGDGRAGRQLCVNARCCILLLRPRLMRVLMASSRALEGWRRLAPATHYIPLPYFMVVSFIEFFSR